MMLLRTACTPQKTVSLQEVLFFFLKSNKMSFIYTPLNCCILSNTKKTISHWHCTVYRLLTDLCRPLPEPKYPDNNIQTTLCFIGSNMKNNWKVHSKHLHPNNDMSNRINF